MDADMSSKAAVIFLFLCVALASARTFPDVVDALSQLQFISLNSNRNDTGDGAWSSALHDRQWLLSVVNNISLTQFPTSNMSADCLRDMIIWSQSLTKQEGWAIQSQYSYTFLWIAGRYRKTCES